LNAAYTKDFIELEKGKTYQLGANSIYGNDAFDVSVYDKNGKFMKALTLGTDTLAFINDYYPDAANKIIFTAVANIKIKVSFYYYNELEYYYLSEFNAGSTGVRTNQLVSYNDLRNRLTWTRYLDNNTIDHYYYYSKLIYDENYFDFSPLNYRIPEVNLVDKSENKSPLKISVSAINKNGIILDGKNDEGVITGYTPGKAFTISAKLTDISHSSTYYNFFFTTEDFNSSANGFGAFVHGRRIYARINGTNYTCNFYLMRDVPTEVTISYNGVDTLKFYRNGELVNTTTTKKNITHLAGTKTMISPVFMNGTTPCRYDGAMEYLKVFNRDLSDSEVRNNYLNSSIMNSEGLDLYYDFTEVQYQSNDGYYPTVKDYTVNTTAKDQILTQLPDDNNREYIKESNNNNNNNVVYKKMVDDKLDNIYNVYPSSINTVNLEFDDNYKDLSFSYKNGDYQSEFIKASERVYSLSYDFINDLEITIRSSNANKVYKYSSNDLSRKVKVIGKNYYHISDGSLYKNDKKLVDNAVHIYNNLALLKSGKVYDMSAGKEVSSILQSGILANAIPLYDFTSEDSAVRTFYSFSEVNTSEGSSIRDGQIMIRDKNMFVFDYNKNNKNNMNLFDSYNTDLYQVSLQNGSLIALMNELNYPSYFMNSDISEVSFDINSEEPIMLLRYNNGYVYAFNYYTGEELFEYGTKAKTTLFRFIIDSLSDDTTLSISNDSYDESAELRDSLIEVKDDKVKEKLNITIGGESTNKDKNEIDEEVVGEEAKNDKVASKNEVTNKYIQVYNYETDTYDVYNTNDLLNPVNKEVVSEKIKIKSDAFLYNYFYDNKINRLLDGSKVLIYGAIIVLVLVNLVFFGRYLSTREVKNRE